MNVSLNVFEITLSPGYDDKKKDSYEMFSCTQVYYRHSKIAPALSLCIVNDEDLL